MSTRQTGIKGEGIACEFLMQQGVTIKARNIRTPYGEIDILGDDHDCLVFAEVKTRKTDTFGLPEEAVNRKKREHMINSALSYLQENKSLDIDWRIDVIAINISKTKNNPKKGW